MKIIIKRIALLFLLLFISNNAISKENALNQEFKPSTHKEINEKVIKQVLSELKLEENSSKLEVCKTRLTRSQSIQDYFIPAQSKAHFDNCAFQKSINYINRITARNDKFHKEYIAKLSEGAEQQELDLLRRKVLFNAGKILHAIQDFYSHTNYLELMSHHKHLEDVPTIEFWNEKGQTEIINLKENGLISGVAWWVFPKKCQKNSPSHAELAKDNEKYILGKKATIWVNPQTGNKFTGFEVALQLAEKSSYQFLLHTFNKYPMLKTYCANEPSEKPESKEIDQ